MGKSRLEAFSDGVIAILITIMILEMKAPPTGEWASLRDVLPVFLCYVMSFVYVAIYWANHHHMLHTVRHVNGAILWANLHLLFWLSLVPFVTAWMGQRDFAAATIAAYGIVMLLCAVAYTILQNAIIADQGPDSMLRGAVGRDWKGKTSLLLYATAIALAYLNRWIAVGIYVLVAVMWLVPDRRIESKINGDSRGA